MWSCINDEMVIRPRKKGSVVTSIVLIQIQIHDILTILYQISKYI